MLTNHSDIIIVGAGACGLMAAKELSAKGKKVTVLEAKTRAGGRIDTMHENPFLQPVEGGAEFIHGNLPVTLQLLKEANIGYTKIRGEMMRNYDGNWKEADEPVDGWDEMIEKMDDLKKDLPFTEFLNTYFSGEKYNALRQSALQYAQGFDAVDPDKASTLSLRNEWEGEEEDNYHVNGGYKQMIDYLQACIKQNNSNVIFGAAVNKIEWRENEVRITTRENETFIAEQAIIAVPIGVLRSKGLESSIGFIPQLPQVKQAAERIGYGNVIKILLQFSHPFWQEQKDALFFFSDQIIATWWTQSPSDYPLLTGWIAGKKADEFTGFSNDDILEKALQSVANIFNKSYEEIKQLLTASYIINWEKDVYSIGAYSYNMIGSEEARELLKKPVQNTLFFAGEALYVGASGGTVEAALVNGLEVANKILNLQE